jgi:hypothetical protein
VLLTRDHCTPSDCAAFRALTDHNQIVANMDERVYDGLIMRYAPSWNAPPPAAAVGPVAALPSSMPTGRPTNAEFPSAASTPPISIMNPEPGPGQAAPRAQAAPAAATNTPAARPTAPPRPAPAAAAPTLAAAAAAKKPPPKPRAAAPVQIAPAAAAPTPAPAPAASNE